MSIASEWIETSRRILKDPEDFFRNETRNDPTGYPLRYAAVSLLTAALITSLTTALYTGVGGSRFAPLAVIYALFGILIGGFIGIFVVSAIVHIFVVLLGGKQGFGKTIATFEYATVISPVSAIASAIPIIGGLTSFIATIYGLYVEIRGIQYFQNMSAGRAAAALLIPLIAVGILLFVVALIAAISIFAAISQSAGPIPA